MYCCEKEVSSKPNLLDEETQYEIYLIDREILGALIIELALLLLIFSACKDRRELSTPQKSYKEFYTTNGSQTTLAGFIVLFIGILIVAQVGYNRLCSQSENLAPTDSLPSDTTPSRQQNNLTAILPIETIFIGYLFNIIACLCKINGASQRVNQQASVTIV